MTPDDFRKEGAKLIEWIAQYMERVEEFPVCSQAEPNEVRTALPASPPQKGEGHTMVDATLQDVESVILKGITHWQSL